MTNGLSREGCIVRSEKELLAAAVALGAPSVPGWSGPEDALVAGLPVVAHSTVHHLRAAILNGSDPLGIAFCSLRSSESRRQQGAVYTPATIVDAMVEWAARQPAPARVIDPGTGSGRFLLAAGRRFRRAQLLGIELDPVAAILARANVAASGLATRARVILGDYRSVELPAREGRTLFIGNPPYVRHHLLDPRWKQWLTDEAARRGLPASQLAGLHVHFFLATVAKAQSQDFGAFVTSAEWLDVNYGSLVRELFLGDLGGQALTVIEPSATPFPDALTTAAITCFVIGSRPATVGMKRIASQAELTSPNGQRKVRRERLEVERRWSHLTRPSRKGPAGYIELGELCRVHRGQVTGANRVWIAGSHSDGIPDSVLFPTVTKARELFSAGRILDNPAVLRRVIDLPVDLDELGPEERKSVERFLKYATSLGVHSGYIASYRKAWWSVGLRQPAPVLATYMARRPPTFVLNRADARHLNIAHGLYPREPLGEPILLRLIDHLRTSVEMADGRTYAGGLTKFEPREMERLLIPGPELLAQETA